MRVLLKDDKVACLPTMSGGDKFELLNGEQVEGKVTVAEVDDAEVGRQVTAALGDGRRSYFKRSDFKRELTWQQKALANIAEGAEVGLNITGRGYSLDVPPDARVDRARGIVVGSNVAVGPSISPKTALNMHGVVKAINGTKAEVKVDDGDFDRMLRASGKKYRQPMRLPLSCLEKVE